MTDVDRITPRLAARMGRYAYWSRYDGKWLVRNNCNLAAIVQAVLQEADELRAGSTPNRKGD